MLIRNKYNTTTKLRKQIRADTVQAVMANERVEMRVDTRIKTKLAYWSLIEAGITNFNLLSQVENGKYDLLANKVS